MINPPRYDSIYHGDCMDYLKTIPDNTIDLVITDPPYKFHTGKGGAFGLETKRYRQSILNNDLTDGFDLDVIDECCRVLKQINIYIWCSKQQLLELLNYFEEKNCFTDIITWHKTNPVPSCNGTYMNDTEYCIFAREKGVKIYGNTATKKKWYLTPTNKADKEKWKHPTIKPLNIISNFIVNSSLEGDVVLDPFMGSGTTAVAAKQLNRHFLGAEINDQYYQIANKRIKYTTEDLINNGEEYEQVLLD